MSENSEIEEIEGIEEVLLVEVGINKEEFEEEEVT
jgi:hypothetical protein